jgi:Flp pilus assembly protein TadG
MAITSIRRLNEFRNDDRGVVAMIFALAMMAFILLLGITVDYGRALHSGSKMQTAMDAAALAAAKALRDKNSGNVATVARTHFDANMKGQAQQYHTITAFEVTSAQGEVKIDARAQVKTLFARAAGFNEINLRKTTTAVFSPVDVEVAVQLDVTGSMQGQKLTDLKVASNDLIDILLPAGGTPNKVRIGLAPFAAGVNAGQYAKAVSNNRAGSDGCVYERSTSANDLTEVAPFGADRLKARADLSGENPCPANSKIQPLTDDSAKLKSTITAMNAEGYTAGHLGTMWSWYMLSPQWSAIWGSNTGAAYDRKTTKKYAILMTDGEYNTYGGVSGNEAKSQKRALDLCTAMKSSGNKDKEIVVYTIGFQLNDPKARDLLKNCATDSSKFFTPQTGDQLKSAFRGIAEEIAALRLSN